jgi:hypothetical protein
MKSSSCERSLKSALLNGMWMCRRLGCSGLSTLSAVARLPPCVVPHLEPIPLRDHVQHLAV